MAQGHVVREGAVPGLKIGPKFFFFLSFFFFLLNLFILLNATLYRMGGKAVDDPVTPNYRGEENTPKASSF